MPDGTRDYHAQRARAERALADAADDECVLRSHRALAELHAAKAAEQIIDNGRSRTSAPLHVDAD